MDKILVERGLSVDRLREVLDYNPETGVFTWKVKTGKKVVIGNIAGCVRKDGYILIRIDGLKYMAHRLAWAHYYGEWPKNGVDHIYGLTGDNRISELRLATAKQNNENQTLRSDNTSGFRGVVWDKNRNKWRAAISQNGKSINLGRFDNMEDAIFAAKKARDELFTHDIGRDAA